MPTSVLVVEDDAETREALGYLLEVEGYGVIAVANGQEALAVLQGGQDVCIVLLDLMMPVMDGWAFMAVRARHPALQAVPVVVISALDPPGAGLDAVACLSKPVDPETLIELVGQHC